MIRWKKWHLVKHIGKSIALNLLVGTFETNNLKKKKPKWTCSRSTNRWARSAPGRPNRVKWRPKWASTPRPTSIWVSSTHRLRPLRRCSWTDRIRLPHCSKRSTTSRRVRRTRVTRASLIRSDPTDCSVRHLLLRRRLPADPVRSWSKRNTNPTGSAASADWSRSTAAARVTWLSLRWRCSLRRPTVRTWLRPKRHLPPIPALRPLRKLRKRPTDLRS